MNKRTSLARRLFLFGLAFGAVAAAAPAAGAWTRTVASMTLVQIGGAPVLVSFPSDGTSGTPNGNSATNVYADFYVVGTGSANMTLSACGIAYNHSGGACGAFVNWSYPASPNANFYDVTVPKWGGTGSQWDYFYVNVLANSATGTATVYMVGLGVSGT